MMIYDSDGESRELYDLCRLYKFKYKEFQQKVEINEKYHNKWTGDLVSETHKELREIKEDMLDILLETMYLDSLYKVTIFNDKVIIHSHRFRDKMKNLLQKLYEKNEEKI